MYSFESRSIVISPKMPLESIEVRIVVENCNTELCITDMSLQGGTTPTSNYGHPAEVAWMMDP